MGQSFYYDRETGGFLLWDKPAVVKREIRPVYAAELIERGFGGFWRFDPQNDVPYMWHDLGRYYYRGELVARTRFNNKTLRHDITEINPDLPELTPVDLARMTEKNAPVFEAFRDRTIERLRRTYEERRGKKELWHLSYSGGKDSQVALSVVMDALSKGSFKVFFGDTSMEFPQTYDAVDKTRAMLESCGVEFYRAACRMDALETWRRFRPPARYRRWCCSVHKSSPIMNLIKNQFKAKASVCITGVRRSESAIRSNYEYTGQSKVTGQVDVRPILDWDAAEVWNEIYSRKLIVNELYKLGAQRAGCVLCPMAGPSSDAFTKLHGGPVADAFFEMITTFAKMRYEAPDDVALDGWRSRSSGALLSSCEQLVKTSKTNSPVQNLDEWLSTLDNPEETLNGWRARMNGALVKGVEQITRTKTTNDELTIQLAEPVQDFGEWLKTLGDVEQTLDGWRVTNNGAVWEIPFAEKEDGFFKYEIRIPNRHNREDAKFRAKIVNIARRAVYCINCGVCAANCPTGALGGDGDKIHIDATKCARCGKCMENHEHAKYSQCLRYLSMFVPDNRDEIVVKSKRKLDEKRRRKENATPLLSGLWEAPVEGRDGTQPETTGRENGKLFLR